MPTLLFTLLFPASFMVGFSFHDDGWELFLGVFAISYDKEGYIE